MIGRVRMTFKRRLATIGAALAVFSVGLLAVSQPAHAGCRTVALVNAANGLAVSAELGTAPTDMFYGMLRARASVVGPWEKFEMCVGDNNIFTLRSEANNRYVSNEENYEGDYQYMLRARASSVGSWERFIMYNVGGDTQWFTGSDGYLVTAELDYAEPDYAMLRSRAKELGPWEHWTVDPS